MEAQKKALILRSNPRCSKDSSINADQCLQRCQAQQCVSLDRPCVLWLLWRLHVQVSIVAHSYGTFEASRLVQAHHKRTQHTHCH